MKYKIITGKKKLPLTLLFYGIQGIGKTNLGVTSDNPVFVGNEENDAIESARMPKPESFSELLDQIRQIRDEENYKTLIVDSLTMLQDLAEAEVLKDYPNKTMATAFGGYGKAYEKTAAMFSELKSLCIELREKKGMNIILNCQCDASRERDPITLVDNLHFTPRLHKSIKGMFMDWVGAIIFATSNDFKMETDKGFEYVQGDGTRVLYTESRPSHVAKNRYNLPYKIIYEKSTTWKTLKKHVDNFYAQSVGPLDAEKIAHAKELAAKAPNELQEKIYEAIEKAADATALNKIITRLEELNK